MFSTLFVCMKLLTEPDVRHTDFGLGDGPHTLSKAMAEFNHLLKSSFPPPPAPPPPLHGAEEEVESSTAPLQLVLVRLFATLTRQLPSTSTYSLAPLAHGKNAKGAAEAESADLSPTSLTYLATIDLRLAHSLAASLLFLLPSSHISDATTDLRRARLAVAVTVVSLGASNRAPPSNHVYLCEAFGSWVGVKLMGAYWSIGRCSRSWKAGSSLTNRPLCSRSPAALMARLKVQARVNDTRPPRFARAH